MKNITINEIAKMAQVSKGTVSKILNNKPGIGEETRNRVLELINRLGYHPNSLAQGLANNRTNTVGLVIPHEAGKSLNGSYWSSIITSITQRAAEDNYNLMIFTPKEEGHLEELYSSITTARRVDGLIIGAEQLDKKSMSHLILTGIPFVLIGRNPNFQHFSVDIDNAYASQAMTEYMIEKGFKKIGFISGPLCFHYNIERSTSYRRTMEKHSLTPIMSEAKAYVTDDIKNAVNKIISQSPDLDALFIGAGGDFLFDILKHLKMIGIDPNKLGITVFDDYPYLDFVKPQLTAVKQPLELLGKTAMECLIRSINNEQLPLSEPLKTSITIRSSCGE